MVTNFLSVKYRNAYIIIFLYLVLGVYIFTHPIYKKGLIEIKSVKEYSEFVSSDETLVYFTAKWCFSDKLLTPLIEQAAQNVKNIEFYKVDVDKNPEICAKLKILAVPEIILFKDGIEEKRVVGADNVADFVKNIH